jgi:signal transduction histidine kinase
LNPEISSPARRYSFLTSCLVLAAGLAASLVIAQIALRPSANELVSLAMLLAGTAGAALATWLLLLRTSFASRWGLYGQAFLGSVIGGVFGLLSILVIAQQMFISTSHDLWVLAATLAFSLAIMTAFSFSVATSVVNRVDQIASMIRSLSGGQRGSPGRVLKNELEILHQDVARLSQLLREAELERTALELERRHLTASISHDLRTPVASVKAIAEALAGDVLESNEERQSYLHLLQREIERLSRMIHDLFDLARLDAGSLKLDRRRIQLDDIVLDVLEGMRPLASGLGVSLEFTSDDGLPDILVDGNRIERVVSNLLRNAIEHSPAGSAIHLRLITDEDGVCLSVTDEGPGVESAATSRVWERFYRGDGSRKRLPSGGDGAGLGLAIVQGFVKAHGGSVGLVSKAGEGSTFRIHLPRG